MSVTSSLSGVEAGKLAQVAGAVLASLPSTRSTSSMAANVSGSICAAQPVTTTRAVGLSRLALRMVWRAWRTASPVTAHVFTMIVLLWPAVCADWRMASDSTVLRRQPRVRTSTVMVRPLCRRAGKDRVSEHDIAFMLDRPGHQHVIVRRPLDLQRAAGLMHGDGALGTAKARCRDRRRASR
jgi:hypothetical protein